VTYPWLEWQKQNNPETTDDPKLHSCPFCSSLHLSVNLGFEGKAARVYCRNCQGSGPWICSEHTEQVVAHAKSAWNSHFAGLRR
jgi:transcription elongation factor Elf1